MDLVEAVHEGYCCSQLLMQLMLNARGEENPALIRAMQGLCHGIGQSEGPCAFLPGGACVLALLAGKGAAGEEPSSMLTPMLNEYASWFYERTAAYGGYACPKVADGLGSVKNEDGTRDPVACGDLLADCWEKICSIVENYGIDITANITAGPSSTDRA